MKYKVTHLTKYRYSNTVNLCYNEARLLLRNTPFQNCVQTELKISPDVSDYRERKDFYGNKIAYFSIEKPHDELIVTSESYVETVNQYGRIPENHQLRYKDALVSLKDQAPFDSEFFKQFQLHSPLIPAHPEIMSYALQSFESNPLLLEGVMDFMRRIHGDFKFIAGYTTIATPLADVIREKKGVCQDFAHVAIAGLRSLGIPASYVSGYIETYRKDTPNLMQPLIGADASHAWVSVYSPDVGWVDFDPTNNKIPIGEHITNSIGRDYSDVSPLKGVIFTSGHHKLSVDVEVKRLEQFPKFFNDSIAYQL
ncbi:MAG: transglutaminase family protein [Chloroherpetonaceae bacterium]|nr:transglutaminase family protein [Chloroherpetonaceae bacterium]